MKFPTVKDDTYTRAVRWARTMPRSWRSLAASFLVLALLTACRQTAALFLSQFTLDSSPVCISQSLGYGETCPGATEIASCILPCGMIGKSNYHNVQNPRPMYAIHYTDRQTTIRWIRMQTNAQDIEKLGYI